MVKRAAPDGIGHQRPDAPLAHRRPGDPLSGCVPAEPDSVSPDRCNLSIKATCVQVSLDTGVMPEKSISAVSQLKMRVDKISRHALASGYRRETVG